MAHPTPESKQFPVVPQKSASPRPKALTETNADISHKPETVPTINMGPAHPVATNTAQPVPDLYDRLVKNCEGIVLGDFQVISLLGRGAMGAVFRARQISLDRDIALKVLSPHYAADPDMLARFKREAKVLSKLHHTNIIGCYAVGESSGVHYLALEYIDGRNLKDILKKDGRLSVADSVAITLDLARALKYAHENQIIHRDVKPDNVLISREGVVKLADLGLAKPEEDDLSLTASGIGMGTPIYMPPEQMRSAKHADARVDIYALGVLLYVIVSKHRPFVAKDFPELLKEKETAKYLSLRKKFDDIPEKLELIIAKMIDHKPDNRYQSMDDLITALEKLDLASPFLTNEFMVHQQQQPKRNKPSSTAESTLFTTSKCQTATKVLPRENVWHVRRIMEDGGYGKVKELTFEQLKHQIETRSIDSRSLACKTADGHFEALSTFAEFDVVFRSLVAKLRAERRVNKLKAEYEKVVHEVEDVERRKWWSRLFLSFGGWVKLLLILAVVVGLGYLAIRFVPPMIMALARILGISS